MRFTRISSSVGNDSPAPPSLFDQQTRFPPALSLESPPTRGPAPSPDTWGSTTARLIPSEVPPKVLAALYHFHPHLPQEAATTHKVTFPHKVTPKSLRFSSRVDGIMAISSWAILLKPSGKQTAIGQVVSGPDGLRGLTTVFTPKADTPRGF